MFSTEYNRNKKNCVVWSRNTKLLFSTTIAMR